MRAEILKLWSILIVSWADQAQATSGHTGETHGVWMN